MMSNPACNFLSRLSTLALYSLAMFPVSLWTERPLIYFENGIDVAVQHNRIVGEYGIRAGGNGDVGAISTLNSEYGDAFQVETEL